MSYQQQVAIAANAQRVFNAIAQEVPSWWGATDRPVTQVGDVFTTSFDQTYWTFRITSFIPGQLLVWQCIDARHIHEGYTNIETEWIGTAVRWEINATTETSVILSFNHDGLTPDLNCYNICTPAWDRFVTQSLKQFVETGKGMPVLV